MDGTFASPIVGTVSNDKELTSGDVHLYPDPSTYSAPAPMLYADCEGLQGGEAIPMGASQARKSLEVVPGPAELPKQRPILHKLAHKVRTIAWATHDERQRREYMVQQLFPRVLYTFSDNVVFVLRNAR